MIKASELRVGNYVLIDTNDDRSGIRAITAISKYASGEGSINYNVGDYTTVGFFIRDAKPISLTPEWLERFGFVLDAFDAWNLELTTRFTSKTLLVFARDYLYMRQFNTDKRQEDDICTIWNKDIMKHFYVHDLQNLYFALTGQELELKEAAQKIKP